jgi:hypothetical protein
MLLAANALLFEVYTSSCSGKFIAVLRLLIARARALSLSSLNGGIVSVDVPFDSELTRWWCGICSALDTIHRRPPQADAGSVLRVPPWSESGLRLLSARVSAGARHVGDHYCVPRNDRLDCIVRRGERPQGGPGERCARGENGRVWRRPRIGLLGPVHLARSILPPK